MLILKEIIFDIPYVPSEEIVCQLDGKIGEERNKITTEDYNKNYKERNFKFRLQTKCITSLFERLLGGFKNDKCRRIIIECVPIITKEARCFEGFYLVQVPYDINNFFQLNDLEKKKKALELIKVGLNEIIVNEDWDSTIFDKVYKQIIDKNYINQWQWKKQKGNPGRQYTAKVFCEHDIYFFNIKLIIEDKKRQVIKEEKIITEKPDEWSYAKYFGDLKWLSNNEVALISKNKDYEFRVKIEQS